MSTSSLLRSGRAGLLATGLCCFSGLAYASPTQDTVPAAAPAAGPSDQVVLLTDGRVLTGELAEDGKNYVLKQKAGTLRLARKQVEGTFDSIAAIYKHKVEQIADDDPDEHRKLANWCLGHKLNAEARVELKRVLSLAPTDRQAKAQLFNLEASEARTAQAATRPEAGRIDEGLVRTAAQMPGARSAATGPPLIFDLAPPLALKRYQEFALTVHPELQKRCAGCHHESSGLPFQLVRAATTREQMNDLVLRTNLDATLALIDREDPSRSPFLVASVLPHKGLNRPILNGTTNSTYRAFAQWTGSLATTPAPLDPAAEGAAARGGFGSQRARPGQDTNLPPLNPTPPSTSAIERIPEDQRNAAASRRRVQELEANGQAPGVPANAQFPSPFTTTGRPGTSASTSPGTMPPLPSPNPIAGGPVKPGNQNDPRPGSERLDPATNPALAPVANPLNPDPKSLYPPEFDKPKDQEKAKTKGKTGLNLDLLDKFLKGGTTPAPAPSAPKG